MFGQVWFGLIWLHFRRGYKDLFLPCRLSETTIIIICVVGALVVVGIVLALIACITHKHKDRVTTIPSRHRSRMLDNGIFYDVPFGYGNNENESHLLYFTAAVILWKWRCSYKYTAALSFSPNPYQIFWHKLYAIIYTCKRIYVIVIQIGNV